MIARIPPLLTWFAVAGSAASVGLAALPVVSRYNAKDIEWNAPARPLAGVPAPETGRTDLSAILALAPFGRPDVSASDALPAPPVAFDFTLQGVALTTPHNASQAIISGGTGDKTTFRIGDALAPGILLSEIAADHVVLNVDGAGQILGFPDAPLPDDAETETPDAPQPASFLRNLIPSTTASPNTASNEDPSSITDRIRAELQRNPRAVLARYGLEETGDGYRITDTAPPDLTALGLNTGDEITALNGQPIGTIEADQPLFDSVAASGTARLQVLRDGQTLSLTVPLQ